MTTRNILLREIAAIIYGDGRFAPFEVWKELHPSQKEACKRILTRRYKRSNQ